MTQAFPEDRAAPARSRAVPPPTAAPPVTLGDRPSLEGPARPPRGALLVDHELAALCGSQIREVRGASEIRAAQRQPASLDLRLGPVAHRIRAGFLPGAVPLAERLAELELERLSLEPGAVLERGSVYLVPLDEELALEPGLAATFNPRSSAGRCDLFTRVLAPGHPRFNEAPAGYRGPLWLEVAPLSFSVRLSRGDRLCQMRLARGDAALSREELLLEHRREPLCWSGDAPISEQSLRLSDDGSLELSLGLSGRDPCGWRAREGAHAIEDFFDPIRCTPSGPRNTGGTGRVVVGHSILPPGAFSIFASRERVVVPPHLAAEMLPVDPGLGELRNNYAGFFDSGFGWRRAGESGRRGTTAVLEVRAHDVPFLVEDGQVFFRLRYFRTSGAPERIYGEGRAGASYREQDLKLARAFREGAPA